MFWVFIISLTAAFKVEDLFSGIDWRKRFKLFSLLFGWMLFFFLLIILVVVVVSVLGIMLSGTFTPSGSFWEAFVWMIGHPIPAGIILVTATPFMVYALWKSLLEVKAMDSAS
jgi:hypothetical protein